MKCNKIFLFLIGTYLDCQDLPLISFNWIENLGDQQIDCIVFFSFYANIVISLKLIVIRIKYLSFEFLQKYCP